MGWGMITKRAARTIRAGILDCRKFVRLANWGYCLQGPDLKGLYGEAWQRTWRSYTPQEILYTAREDYKGLHLGGL
jgi:hypothetical protein